MSKIVFAKDFEYLVLRERSWLVGCRDTGRGGNLGLVRSDGCELRMLLVVVAKNEKTLIF